MRATFVYFGYPEFRLGIVRGVYESRVYAALLVVAAVSIKGFAWYGLSWAIVVKCA